MAAGHGGQILVADSTMSLLSGVDLVDLGLRRLRDLSTPVGIFQVGAEGLPSDFPPLRTLDATIGNLRPRVADLIGREAELEDVMTSLKEHRLVTLTGVGGVGKTRLALEVAARMSHEFTDGVWVFELATITDPAAVPDAIASALTVAQLPGKSLTDSIATAQEDRVRLLVFDNCEHVIDAASDLVEALFEHSSTVTVLATSREGLGIANEQLWPVPSLDVGAGSGSAAVRLFLERASSVAPRLLLTNPEEASAVVEICERLDGIPLAIELAASRTVSMSATELRDRLDKRFQLLVGSRRGLERHQTLRHAVQWSYDLLDDDERALLQDCSVFVGGFDIKSVCAVARSGDGEQTSDELAALDLLDALVRKSLLSVDRSSVRTRFSMLETIRQFAEDKLVAAGAAANVQAAHARYFASCEYDLEALWDGPRQHEAYDWFATEFANLRSAFRWAARNDEQPESLDVAASIATYASFLGYATTNFEPLSWAEELVEKTRAVGHPRFELLSTMAAQCWVTGRVEDAGRYAVGVGDWSPPANDALPQSAIAPLLGAGYMTNGQHDRALDWYRSRLQRGGKDAALNQTGVVLALLGAGRTEDALNAAERLISAAEDTRNPYTLAFAHLTYGYALFANEIPALEGFRRGLAVARDSGNRMNESHLVAFLAQQEARYGDTLQALDAVAAAIRIYHDCGNTETMRNPLAILAILVERVGRQREAATLAGFAVTPFISATLPGLTATITSLRQALGHSAYESLTRTGELMTAAEVVRYAYDQIDQARAELKAASK